MGEIGSSEKPRAVHSSPVEWHRALALRVASSSTLQKSNRLRELLLFLCDRAAATPQVVIHEQEIGVEVFGRSSGYDTAEDNLVRVQVSQLRRKLQQYFDAEGRDEPWVIEIPKGSYTPIFRERETPVVPEPPRAADRLRLWVKAYPLAWVLTIGLAAGVGASGMWLARRIASRTEARPNVDLLWQRAFGDGRPVCVVPSDSSLVLFQDLIGRQLTLNEYKRSDFLHIAGQEQPDRERAVTARAIVTKPSTHIADARLVGLVSELNAAHRLHSDVVFARDFGPAYLQSHNVILLGTRRANPWIEIFENQLNFRTRFQEAPHMSCSFENHAPLPGESGTYTVDWGRRGYCRLAFLPNPARDGNVLLISGTDMASTEAGGGFVTSERWLEVLRAKLGLSGRAAFPYFEVLLGVDFPASRSVKFDIVACRTPKS